MILSPLFVKARAARRAARHSSLLATRRAGCFHNARHHAQRATSILQLHRRLRKQNIEDSAGTSTARAARRALLDTGCLGHTFPTMSVCARGAFGLLARHSPLKTRRSARRSARAARRAAWCVTVEARCNHLQSYRRLSPRLRHRLSVICSPLAGIASSV